MNRQTEKKELSIIQRKEISDILISDFSNVAFQDAFKKYFKEFGVEIKNWDALFDELTKEGKNKAYVKLDENRTCVGFILFKTIQLPDGFFEQNLGFIREFWVSKEYRGRGYGSELIKLAEEFFKQKGISKSILTTDTAEHFYKTRGYFEDKSYIAKNQDEVFVKEL